MDPLTGEILAFVSGLGGNKNDQITGEHPPGSLFTPFVYLTAFTRGFNPASLVWDIPLEIPGLQNAIGENLEFNGPLRLRNAFANDYLIPAIQLINQVGVENVLKTAQDLGMKSMSFK